MGENVSVVEVLVNILRKEIENIRAFIREPKGVFETIDKIIVDARTEIRKLKPTILRG